MALQSVSQFATFDYATTGFLQLDISPNLEEALLFDMNLMGALQRRGCIEMDNPLGDIVYYWGEANLNTDTVTASGSVTSSGTTINVATGQGARVHTGDFLYDTASGKVETIQVTAISSDALTVARGINSSTQTSIADGATLAIIRAEQEFSDIGTDASTKPTARTGYTQIFSGKYDLQISGSQIARRTIAFTELQNQVARQLAWRMVEFKVGMTRAIAYAPLLGPGSDSVYRAMGSLRYWAANGSGTIDTAVGTLNGTPLNLNNSTLVGLGGSPDMLACHHALSTSLATIDSSNRRMIESETRVGYFVQEVTLDLGNTVEIVLDNRLVTGDAFMFQADKIHVRPYSDRAMFVIAATDFTDGVKRRVLGEWGLEVHNPSLLAHLQGCS